MKDCRVSKTGKCNACKKPGHLKVACMQELQKQGSTKREDQKAGAVQEESDSSTGEDDNFEKVNYVSHARDRGTEAPLLNKNGEKVAKVKGTPDTGCTTSLIRNDIVNRNKIIINKFVRPILKVADGRRLPVEGTAKLTCTTSNTVVKQCKCFKKARTVSPTTLPQEEEFKDIISDELNPKPMNCTPMKIELIPGATPSKNMYTKRVPLPFEKEAEKVLQNKGVITRVHRQMKAKEVTILAINTSGRSSQVQDSQGHTYTRTRELQRKRLKRPAPETPLKSRQFKKTEGKEDIEQKDANLPPRRNAIIRSSLENKGAKHDEVAS